MSLTREQLYFRFLIEQGGIRRYGDPFWRNKARTARIEEELGVIEDQEFSGTFVMLADVMQFCRDSEIPYGPGRGSVGGCYTAYLAGIHDVDSLEFGLFFQRFLNEDRVTFPDVDIDISQRHRARVLQYIVDTYNKEDQVVLQVGAFVRAGGRAVVDLMLAALSSKDPQAGATATSLKRCFPDGSITGGAKVNRELEAWLDPDRNIGHGDKQRFREIAEQAGWLDTMLKLDGMYTHLGKHAAGVVILRKDDVPNIPQVQVRNAATKERHTVTAYDMYALEGLSYLKWDFLGLRTLDVIVDAHKFEGGTGRMDDLLDEWREHRDEPEAYEVLCAQDTVGIFQMETDGYRRVLKDFQPNCFNHIVQLVALYRPGALDYEHDDGRNMVQVFTDRVRGKELPEYAHAAMEPLLKETYGVMLYQEQQMAVARELAGFSLAEADMLRKAIGKKRKAEMDALIPLWQKGVEAKGIEPAVADRVWENIEAAARYSWNKAHSVEYGIITWWTAYLKSKRLGFYAAEINSWEGKGDRQANVIGEARQHVEFLPPDVNVAESRFTVDQGKVVFGLNGIKGMGDSYRTAILVERLVSGDFISYEAFCRRLPSVPVTMKLALIKCGAFDSIEDRVKLLSVVTKPGPSGKRITVAEYVNHYAKSKHPKPLPDITDWEFPDEADIAQGEMDAMGYYISTTPMEKITKSLARHTGQVIGGQIDKVATKRDKNDNEYGMFTLITPALTKQRVLMFHQAWMTFRPRCDKGKQLLFRGRKDGDAFLADACWEPDDVRAHKTMVLERNGDKQQSDFDGSIQTVLALENAGYKVTLL